jgi:hypothetical protein
MTQNADINSPYEPMTLQNDIMLYLQHVPSPISIDTLIELSGHPIVDVLNVMEGLRRKKLVSEKEGRGKGIYFADNAKLMELTKKGVSEEETKRVLKKIIDSYMVSPGKNDGR